jgi:DNA polymerase
LYLEALGIPCWRARDAAAIEPPRVDFPAPAAEPVVKPPADPRPPASRTSASAPPIEAPPPYDDLPPDIEPSTEDLDAGIAETAPAPQSATPVANLDWHGLENAARDCRACRLCERRTNSVFGVGDRNADLMFVGEAPGQDEDLQGEPFVGRAGQLLNRMLTAAGLDRGRVYIANIVKCRPPNNRNPQPDEAAACQAFLARQITLVAPRLLVCLGGVAATNLLGASESVGRLRGRVHHYGPHRIPVLVTYHPSYYLRSPAEKAKGWRDLQTLMRLLQDARQNPE